MASVVALMLQSCSNGNVSRKSGSPDKKLPAAIAVSPSSFHCEVKIIEIDSLQLRIMLRKIIQQGSTLFYSVVAGDTIRTRMTGNRIIITPGDSILEMIIEERLKLNSEIPEFIVKQIISD